jgi:hypothetical protein
MTGVKLLKILTTIISKIKHKKDFHHREHRGHREENNLKYKYIVKANFF